MQVSTDCGMRSAQAAGPGKAVVPAKYPTSVLSACKLCAAWCLSQSHQPAASFFIALPRPARGTVAALSPRGPQPEQGALQTGGNVLVIEWMLLFICAVVPGLCVRS